MFEKIIEDPLKLWGSIFAAVVLIFVVVNSSDSKNEVFIDPFSSSSFISEEELEANEEPIFLSSFSEEEDDYEESDSVFEDEKNGFGGFDNSFIIDQPVINSSGSIEMKKFDMNRNSFVVEKKETDSKDQKIEELEKRLKRVENRTLIIEEEY